MLNEQYIKYYCKDICSMPYQYRNRLASKLIDVVVDEDPTEYVEDLLECFLPPLNSPNSITNAIRRKEKNYRYLYEEELEVKPTKDVLKLWVNLCKNNLDKRLIALNFKDFHLKCSSNLQTDKIVDAVNYDQSDKGKDIVPMFQVFCPIEKGNPSNKQFVEDAINMMNDNGYNNVEVKTAKLRHQPFDDVEILLLMMTFEAIYTDKIDELSENLYHVTTLDAVKKMKHDGYMLPFAKTTGDFKHRSRLYLFSNAPLEKMLEFMKERHIDPFGKMCILKIDRSKLISSNDYINGKMLFYLDPAFNRAFGKTAIYTESPIPLDFIDDEVALFKYDTAGKLVKDGEISLKNL